MTIEQDSVQLKNQAGEITTISLFNNEALKITPQANGDINE
jgi:hypothetical protein